MVDQEVQKYMLIIEGQMLPDKSMNPKYLLLAEQEDGRTWRRATGDDILRINEKYPKFFKAVKSGYYEPDDEF